MKRPWRGSEVPLWRDEFSFEADEERYVSRRQFGKFLVLTSLGMFVGNVWILLRSWFARPPAVEERVVARACEVAVGGVKLFNHPGPQDPCILVRLDEQTFVAYSQKCTHLSCAVYFEPPTGRLACPCHQGYFAARDGSVLQGPPPRPLPRVALERRGDDIVARGVEG